MAETRWRGNVAGLTEQNIRDWAEWQREWLHCLAATGEGLCPVCTRGLDPVTMPGCTVAGHCVPCRKYWFIDTDAQETGYVLDHNPWDGSPRSPQRP